MYVAEVLGCYLKFVSGAGTPFGRRTLPFCFFFVVFFASCPPLDKRTWGPRISVGINVVCLVYQGQLIETSGAMSGGGGQPLSGRMNTNAQKARQRSSGGQTSNWTESTLAEKERELAACEAELTAARQRREQLEDAFAKMARRRQEAQRTITKCQVSRKAHQSVHCVVLGD